MSEKVKGNSFRNKTAQTEVPKAPRSFALPRFNEFFANPKYVLAWGMFFIVLGVMLEMAFLSHIFTGRNDQSTLDILENQSIKEIGRTTTNVLGVFGAVVSQVFVYRWFGIAAILLPIIPITAGWALINKTLPFSLSRLTKQIIFFTIWVSALMGYVVLMSGTESTLSFLSGGFGYEINVILFAFLKWGSILVIALVLFLYIIFFYNVNSLDFLLSKQKESEDEAEDELKEPEAPAVRMNVARPTVSETVVEEETPIINQVIKEEITPPEPPIIPLLPNEEIIEEEVVDLPEPIIEKEDTTTFEVDFGPEVKSVEKEPQEESEGISLEIENPIAIGTPTNGAPGLLSAEELGAQIVKEFGQYDPTLDLPNFIYPDGTLLREPNEHDNKEKVSQEELESNKNRIVETLANYGIKIAKIKAAIGPTVTLYEIIPEAGVRISKIQSLEKDIAMSLSALGIRIIAPMPGRGTIGIEVPNKHRETVFMRSVINSPSFTNCTYDLPVIMGKTISNDIYVADLAKMPHLLMAGATGQGKSVGLNVLLASLIYKKHPSQLKFVLVDPKKVELTLFNKLERHYLAKLPNTEEAIITDTKKVINTLNSLCIEMDTRYDLLKDAAVRNLKEYNAKFVQRQLNPEKGHRFLPFIVLVIDELADLMMTAGKEVETPIARLAQLARAVGIHLVLATQRPSVKVITGLIKANFPARLSFRVTSSIDSRTILDAGGAEQLVGQGDMLLSLNNEIIRLQCPFIDTKEVEGLCNFVGNQRGYDEAYALPEYEGDEAGETRDDIDIGDFDPLLPDGARLVIMHQQGSTSLIQRKMKLGYNRAGRIIDQLESIGIVGQFTGSKAREVLFHEMDALEEHLKSLGLS